jgi:hypothetical protein
MKRSAIPLALAFMAFSAGSANSTTIVGDLNNFDTLNDTGQLCYGFEIEIDGVISSDITYTFDWNHYGAPKISQDITDAAHPKVFVRYESTRNADGTWGANGSFTNPAIPTITPPAGHTCTDPSVNEGCEHFGVGYYGTPTAIKYNWLVDGGAAGLVHHGTPVAVAPPRFVYTPPAAAQPAQVVAAIPAPVVPVPGKEFGEPSWVKVIKTTTHNANPVALQDLISDDADGDGRADWQNGEPDQVETEWHLLQVNNTNPAKAGLDGGADDMGDGSETVTRRYEFYRYGAAPNTLDGETGEAMCSEVNPTTDPNDPNYLHGLGNHVAVTDANGNTYYVDCTTQVVVGNYIGAQMAGFAAAAPLGLIDHLQEGASGTPYTPRTVVVGGNSPFAIAFPSGSLPPGLTIDSQSGVLEGTPTAGGDFPFTLRATDANGISASQTYSLHIAGLPAPQLDLVVAKLGSGSGKVAGSSIDCGINCSVHLDAGTAVSLTATPAAGSVFGGWSGPCTGTLGCDFTLNASSTVSATFTRQWLLSVTKGGGGTGSVAGNGINCDPTCSILLDEPTSVSLAATPASGSVFTGWSGDCSGIGTCDTTMTAARSVTATFVLPNQPYTLDLTLAGNGTVTSSPKGINCGKRCSTSFTVGDIVTLTAKPDKKHAFLGWTGACSGTSTTCTVSMMGNRSVGANFN